MSSCYLCSRIVVEIGNDNSQSGAKNAIQEMALTMCHLFIMLFLPSYQTASEEDGQQYLDGPWTKSGTFCVVTIMLTRLLIQEWEIEFAKLRSIRILVIIRTSEAAVTIWAPSTYIISGHFEQVDRPGPSSSSGDCPSDSALCLVRANHLDGD